MLNLWQLSSQMFKFYRYQQIPNQNCGFELFSFKITSPISQSLSVGYFRNSALTGYTTRKQRATIVTSSVSLFSGGWGRILFTGIETPASYPVKMLNVVVFHWGWILCRSHKWSPTFFQGSKSYTVACFVTLTTSFQPQCIPWVVYQSKSSPPSLGLKAFNCLCRMKERNHHSSRCLKRWIASHPSSCQCLSL